MRIQEEERPDTAPDAPSEQQAQAQRQGTGVVLQAALVSRLNLADFQNAVPALHELVVVNHSAHALQALTLSVSAEPPVFQPRQWALDAVGPGQTFHVAPLDLPLNGAHLSRLTEAETATVVFELRSAQAPAEVLARCTRTVALLPRQQWGGLQGMPEMVAAFVQPNDPAVDRLLKAAAVALQSAGRVGAIDGYAQGPRRAWELASALWTAVLQCGLHYALPPASFEQTGQKVRSPHQVLEAGLGTCLDLSLLFAAGLEQAHLNPLLVFTRGHAFVGLWLREETFASAVVDDVTALRKRLKLQELIVFETTLAAQGKPVAFSQALAQANKQLDEALDADFELVVDIRRARLSRIRPLALAQALTPPPDDAEPTDTATGTGAVEPPPELPPGPGGEPPPAELDPKDRLARWQRKLLDLSLRNALLHFKPGKKSLLLEAAAPALEDALAGGQALKLVASPALMEGRDPRSQTLHEARTLEDLHRQHAAEALRRRELVIRLDEEEVEARLVELFRGARSALQEGGANTLYVALGFLTWTRPDKPETRLKAPLVLLPVTLQRKSARSGFTLGLHEDEPLFNPTLVEMLRQDFQLELGVAAGDLPRDDNGLDIGGIWNRVRTAIKDIRGWEVSEEVVLSMFSFAKYLMWKDLVARTEALRRSPVVAHLLDTPREPYASPVAFPEPRRLDEDYPPQQVFSPLPADSSQLSAVMAAAKGKDFVLIGPPGTGKSQTIANLIAQCLAEGKRVLFVAEKIAALDVVYRRLREVGLGEFCLELHSSKSRKLEVLGQLQRAWDCRGGVDEAGWAAQAQQLQRVRSQLSTYVQRLHQRHANGLSVYQAIGTVVGGEGVPALRLAWPSAQVHDTAALADLRERVARLQVNATAVGACLLPDGPLAPVLATQWSAKWQQEMQRAATVLRTASLDVCRAAQTLCRLAGLDLPALSRGPRLALGRLAQALPQAAAQDWSFCAREDADHLLAELRAGQDLLTQHRALSTRLPAPWPAALRQSLEQALGQLARRRALQAELGTPWPAPLAAELAQGVQRLEEMHRLRAGLSVSYGPGLAQLPVGQLQREWAKAQTRLWPLSWLSQRRVRAALEATIDGAGEPRVAEDLAALVRLRQLHEEVLQLDPGAQADGLWAGARTRVEVLQSALRTHAALLAARQGQPYRLDGLGLAAEGACGERWQREARRLKALHELDRVLADGASLTAPSLGLWQGLATDESALRAALAFEQERDGLVLRGALATPHAEVAGGRCGAELQQRHALLQARAQLEARLHALDGLQARCPGTWRGLDTEVEDLGQVARFQAELHAGLQGLALPAEALPGARAALRALLASRRAEL
ncbi:DUF4011 domain-containing protein, partial [Ideonella livida]